MKIKNLLLSLFVSLFFTSFSFAQDTIAAWTFPSTSADSLIDVSISLNSSRYISCQYGTWAAPTYLEMPIDYSTNGSSGAPDKCAKIVGWNDGADSAQIIIKFKTTGYSNLKLYSKQQAGGSNPGPRDFKAQYKLSGTSIWNDIVGGTITCANDWTTGILDGIDLPSSCEDQSSNVSIRWVQTSNFDINGGTVTAAGIMKIDDIVITGEVISGIESIENTNLNIFPNPCKGNFSIVNDGNVKSLNIFNLLGKCVYQNDAVEIITNIDNFVSGTYFIQVTNNENEVSTSKLIVE